MKRIRQAVAVGAAGGVVATIVIDVIQAFVMPLMGLPATGAFAIIGDTAAGFFELIGLQVAGGVLLGASLHYLIGLALGAILGAGVAALPAFRLTSIKCGIGVGILYTELVSLPILVTPPLILNWGRADTVQWFGFSIVMHAIWGTVLGTVVAHGLGAARRQRP